MAKSTLDVTWILGEPRVLNCTMVRYPNEVKVDRNGKIVTETRYTEFMACGSRPATEAEVEAWREQP